MSDTWLNGSPAIDVDRVNELHAAAMAMMGHTHQPRLSSSEQDSCVSGALGNADNGARYLSDCPSPLHLAALSLYYITGANCYGDGNKRVAWSTAVDILRCEGISLDVEDEDAIEFVLDIAEGKVRSSDDVVQWMSDRLVEA